MTNIAETVIPITLGGQKRAMVFNLNTMAAFEELRKKSFTDTVVKLYEELEPLLRDKNSSTDAARVGLRILSRIPMLDLRALLYAALHEYDEDDNPTWPLSVTQIGRMIGPSNILEVFGAFLRGHQENLPTKEEMGEAAGAPATSALADAPIAPTRANGGAASFELPEGVFDSESVKSGA